MSALKQEVPAVTQEQYFRLRNQSDTKLELHDGILVAMAGGSPSHGRLGMMVSRLVFDLVEPNGCEAFNSDTSVIIQAHGNYYFPDTSVVCSEAEFDSENNLINPVMIVEVLSPSTALYDRNTKFARYQSIPTLQYYLLIWQDAPRLELFTRPENSDIDEWTETVIEGVEAKLHLPFFIEPLKLSALYRTITFDAQT